MSTTSENALDESLLDVITWFRRRSQVSLGGLGGGKGEEGLEERGKKSSRPGLTILWSLSDANPRHNCDVSCRHRVSRYWQKEIATSDANILAISCRNSAVAPPGLEVHSINRSGDVSKSIVVAKPQVGSESLGHGDIRCIEYRDIDRFAVFAHASSSSWAPVKRLDPPDPGCNLESSLSGVHCGATDSTIS